ncbi:MAG: anthrone oxygenase family protein [Pseudomonadota bacterium]
MENAYLAHAINFTTLGLFGLIAGFFYAFSVCVMPGLNRIDPTAAITAMQAINEAVRNPVFFVTFFLTPVCAIAAAIVAYNAGDLRPALIMVSAAAVYFALALILTASINVPMNEALATVDPNAADAAQIWADYTGRWTFWNTVRTITSLLAMLVFAFAMTQMDRSTLPTADVSAVSANR